MIPINQLADEITREIAITVLVASLATIWGGTAGGAVIHNLVHIAMDTIELLCIGVCVILGVLCDKCTEAESL